MTAAKAEQFQKDIADKPKEELLEIAVTLFQEKETIRGQLIEFQNASSEMAVQFQQMKMELDGARKEIETLQKLNQHLTGVRDLREKELFGRSTEKMEDVLDHAINEENANPDPLADDMPDDDPEKGPGKRGKFLFQDEGKKERRKKKKGKREEDLSGLPVSTFYDYDIDELNALYGEHNWSFAFWELTQTVEHIQPTTYLRNTYTPIISVGADHDLVRSWKEERMIPKSLASASLLSWIMTEKFSLYLPLYRQEHDPNRFGFPLSRQTMSNWIIYACRTLLFPVYQYMTELLQNCRYQQCDETTYTVIRDGRRAGTKSYVWIHRTSELAEGPSIIVYCYEKTRNSDHLRRFFADLQKELFLSCDGYSGYPSFAQDYPGLVILCGCLMHVRRYFVDALSVLNTKGLSEEQVLELPEVKVLRLIAEIYHAETPLRSLTAEERYARRQTEVREKYDSFISFVRSLDPEDPAFSDKMKQAVSYTMNQEPNICRFLEDGNIPCDNGACERNVKPVALGRRNYLFSSAACGAESNVIATTLTETAKANGADPYYYQKYLLEQMPKHLYDNDREYLSDLMPWSESYTIYEKREKQEIVDRLAPQGNEKPRTPRKKDGIFKTVKKVG